MSFSCYYIYKKKELVGFTPPTCKNIKLKIYSIYKDTYKYDIS
nr:MAG TPA: hypothetical protein [Bacteriophage sp.]